MFREVARKRQALPVEECLDLLGSQLRGVLAVNGDMGYPYAMPLNHYYNEADGKLYFHSGKTGHRTDSIQHCNKASFCVHDSGTKTENGWALQFRSVIVFGRIEWIEDREQIYDIARKLSHKFTDDEAYIDREIEQSGPGTCMFALVPEYMTGKLVTEQ